MTTMRVYTDTNITPEPWMAYGACLETGGEIFFPAVGDVETADRARDICDGCDVRNQCLTYALERREKYGIWGSTNERQRRRILKGQP